MALNWDPLRRELDRHRAAGLAWPVWWRDDDAVLPSAALDHLLDLRGDAPISLAVIPEPAGFDLYAALKPKSGVSVLAHGWRHADHAPAGEKKAEFGAHRPEQAMAADLALSRMRLGPYWLGGAPAVFAPPWNRMAPTLPALLRGVGFRAVSTYGPRPRAEAAPGLLQVNTHLDPIDWRGSRSVVEPAALIARAAALLKDRREGAADADEPFGFLTHHLAHDAAIWRFCAAWTRFLADEAADIAQWRPPESWFRPGA